MKVLTISSQVVWGPVGNSAAVPALWGRATVYTSHISGPRPTRMIDVALMAPMVATSRANSAGARQVPSSRERAVSPIIHGRPAHGRSSTDMRSL